jgi:hypothetical protein
MKFIIRQTNPESAYSMRSDSITAIYPYDICKSKLWVENNDDDYLNNKRNNGWRNSETSGRYTKFKLELIK